MNMTSEIEQLIRRFISGADTSIEVANQIEVVLDNCFQEDEYVQQTVEMLAMYRPDGGELLFDTIAIQKRLVDTLEYLK